MLHGDECVESKNIQSTAKTVFNYSDNLTNLTMAHNRNHNDNNHNHNHNLNNQSERPELLWMSNLQQETNERFLQHISEFDSEISKLNHHQYDERQINLILIADIAAAAEECEVLYQMNQTVKALLYQMDDNRKLCYKFDYIIIFSITFGINSYMCLINLQMHLYVQEKIY